MSNWMMGAVATVAAGSFSIGAQAAAFQNGSFELPNTSASIFLAITSVAQAPTGWIPGGALGGFALFRESTGTFAGLVAHEGIHLIGFGGNGSAGATIEQVFDTVPALSYTVSFYTTAQQLGNGPQSYKAEAFTGNGVTSLGSDAGSIPVVNSWANHTFVFVASGTSSLLRFTDTSNGAAASSLNWALDNVTISPVPEPGAWAMLLGGLGCLAMRRRRSRIAGHLP